MLLPGLLLGLLCCGAARAAPPAHALYLRQDFYSGDPCADGAKPPRERAKIEPSLGRVAWGLDQCVRNPYRLIYRPDADGVDGGAYVKFSCSAGDKSCTALTFSAAGCAGAGTQIPSFVSTFADGTCRPLPSWRLGGGESVSGITYVKSQLVPYARAAENFTTPYSVVYGQDECQGDPLVLMEAPSLSVCKATLNKQKVISSRQISCSSGKQMQTCEYDTADCTGRTSTCEAPADTVSRVGVCGSSTFGDDSFKATKHSCDTATGESGGGISFGTVCILLLVVVVGVLLVMGYRKYNRHTQDFGGGTDFNKLTDGVGSYS
jgi:hypothetical protein